MRYRRMGASGLQLSEVGLGTWATVGDTLDLDASCEVLTAAYDLGVNLFDTAEVYAAGAAEEILGQVFRRQGWQRDTLVVCTKVMWGVGDRRPNGWGLGRKHVIEGCHASLKRLQLDYVDLFLCHRHDPDAPLEETVEAMGSLVRAGKVLYWGTSEWPAHMISAARDLARRLGVPQPVVDQSRYNLFERGRVERDLSELTSNGLGVCAWSPLGYGILAGRYTPGQEASSRLERDGMAWLKEDAIGGGRGAWRLALAAALTEMARDAGSHPACLALAWALGRSSVSSAITGASVAGHLTANIKGLGALGDTYSTRKWIEAGLTERGLWPSTELTGEEMATGEQVAP